MNLKFGIPILIIVLVLNNYLLLNFLGYFSESPDSGSPATPDTIATAEQSGLSQGEQEQTSESDAAPVESPNTGVAAFQAESSTTTLTELSDRNFITSFKRLSKSEDFTDIMDEYTMTSGQRLMETQREFMQMSAEELYELAVNSERGMDRAMALQTLSQGKIGDLGVYELKNLYQLENLDIWARSKIVERLLEEDDPDGLAWARQIVTEQSQNAYISHELLEGIYEKDVEFVRDYLDQIDLEGQQVTSALIFFSSQDPELAGEFLQKNLDAILNSSNRRVFQLNAFGAKVEMNSEQQEQVLQLLESRNRQKRQFAISLLNSIGDTEVLRRAYDSLSKRSEKRTFLFSLYGDEDAPEKRQLAKDLAAESGYSDLSTSFR